MADFRQAVAALDAERLALTNADPATAQTALERLPLLYSGLSRAERGHALRCMRALMAMGARAMGLGGTQAPPLYTAAASEAQELVECLAEGAGPLAAQLAAEQHWLSIYNVSHIEAAMAHRPRVDGAIAALFYEPVARMALGASFRFHSEPALAKLRAYGVSEAALEHRNLVPHGLTPLGRALHALAVSTPPRPERWMQEDWADAALVRFLVEHGADVHAPFRLGADERTALTLWTAEACGGSARAARTTAVGGVLYAAADAIVERRLAVAMALHGRLGAHSLLGRIDPGVVAAHIAPGCHILSPGALPALTDATELRRQIYLQAHASTYRAGIDPSPRLDHAGLFEAVLRTGRAPTPRHLQDFRLRHWLGRGHWARALAGLHRRRGARYVRRLRALARATRRRGLRRWHAVLRGCMRVGHVFV